jgi:hypothetical protein
MKKIPFNINRWLGRPVSKMSLGSLPVYLGLGMALTFMLFGSYWLSAIGIGLFCYLALTLIDELGRGLPVDSLILFIASLQWIAGPVMAYAGWSNHYKYYMYVDEAEYMSLAVPGVFGLMIGLKLFKNRFNHKRIGYYFHRAHLELVRNPQLPYYLIGVGLVCSVLMGIVPSALRFVFFLLSNFKFIGVIYFLFSSSGKKWVVLGLTLFVSFLSALHYGMFHDFLLWTIFLGIYALNLYRIGWIKKMGIVLLGLAVIFSLQSVKREFRQQVWSSDYTGNESALFFSLVRDQFFEEEGNTSSAVIEDFVVRINQGWIISRLMFYVPAQEDFCHGETIDVAVRASLLPRFLAPNKALAGGQVNFERFTGFELKRTSMGMSLLGEGYVNFGKLGAALFLMCVGGVLSGVLRAVAICATKEPTAIFWVPLMFMYVVKAETELMVVLNYLIKSSLLIFISYLLFKQLAKTKILRKRRMH